MKMTLSGPVSMAAALLAVLLLVPGAARADGIGRLFFTPDERRVLDAAREQYDPARQEVIVKEGPAAAPAAAPPPPPPMPDLEVEGLVIRSSGRNAAWVNGTRLESGQSTEEGIRVEADAKGGSVRFVLPGGGDTGPIKPGQRLDPNVGQVKERYTLTPSAGKQGD